MENGENVKRNNSDFKLMGVTSCQFKLKRHINLRI